MNVSVGGVDSQLRRFNGINLRSFSCGQLPGDRADPIAQNRDFNLPARVFRNRVSSGDRLKGNTIQHALLLLDEDENCVGHIANRTREFPGA